jgi:hypothetical protein
VSLPRLIDSELLTLAVAQVLLDVHSEARWLRLVPAALPARSRTCPASPATTSGCGWRCRCSSASSGIWPPTPIWSDPVWLVDCIPVECARSRPTVRRSQLAGVAGYGYCPSHSRWFGACGCT